MTYGEPLFHECMNVTNTWTISFDPAAEKTCEGLLNQAIQTDPGNCEVLQALASVRLSQQRQDDAKQCAEQAWSSWKDLEAGTSISLLQTIQSSNCTIYYQTILVFHPYRLAFLSSSYSSSSHCIIPPYLFSKGSWHLMTKKWKRGI